jgi:pyridoxal phosphate enzyme (YggS family)
VTLADELAALRAEIARRAPDREVTVVAVTKGHPVEVARAAYAEGLRVLGENYAQDLLAKAPELPDDVQWHFIGRLQRNKVKALAAHVALWQSVDRPSVVREIAKRSPGAAVLIQPNLSGDPSKGGCPRDETEALVADAMERGLDVRGLMGVGIFGDREATAAAFRWLIATADRLQLPVRSIGMTDDLDLALDAGSTMVRVGRTLFGERPTGPPRPH